MFKMKIWPNSSWLKIQFYDADLYLLCILFSVFTNMRVFATLVLVSGFSGALGDNE